MKVFEKLEVWFECPKCKHQTAVMPASNDMVKLILKERSNV